MIKSTVMEWVSALSFVGAISTGAAEAFNLIDFTYKSLVLVGTFGGLYLGYWSKKQSVRLREAENELSQAQLDLDREKFEHEKGK